MICKKDKVYYNIQCEVKSSFLLITSHCRQQLLPNDDVASVYTVNLYKQLSDIGILYLVDAKIY